MNNFLSNAELKLETDLTTHSLLSVPEEEEAPIPFPMDKIQHHFMEVRGLKHHVAEIGTGPNVVVFLHGFPEIWYSWRHQMIGLANAGFRTIAPDYRGYGLSDSPPEPSKATYGDIISDLLGILDALHIPKVFLVGKDLGTWPAYYFALKHPERALGVVTLGVPFLPPELTIKFQDLPEGIYVSRWLKPGRAEADFGRLDAKTVFRNVYVLFSRSEIPTAKENQEIMDLVDASTPLPPWFTEEDLAVYGTLYEKSGFETALKVPYRSFDEDFGIKDPKVEVPALLIMGEKDYVLKFPGMDEYIQSGMVKDYVPKLEIIYVPEGSHFVQEQFPEEVNSLLLNFLAKHT
ncbi:bifunctional epoxide hydrolase 2-like [Momordica charantia]|uniref:Bifunctional epoxide hydrolase 2-like n=1 Tax=Momordica charantia TaxID=3673 RepID=A0A6J1CLM7_MOMCH|nr:bifunctional epoxide hydrolase 2-like [Momordica charantia]